MVGQRMLRALTTRRIVAAAAFGGGGITALGGLTYGLLLAEVKLARKIIKGTPELPPPATDGLYGAHLPGEPVSFAVLGDSTAAGIGVVRMHQHRAPVAATGHRRHVVQPRVVALELTAADQLQVVPVGGVAVPVTQMGVRGGDELGRRQMNSSQSSFQAIGRTNLMSSPPSIASGYSGGQNSITTRAPHENVPRFYHPEPFYISREPTTASGHGYQADFQQVDHGSFISNIISDGKSESDLFLTFTFSWNFPDVEEGTSEATEKIQQVTQMAEASTTTTVSEIRDLVQKGVIKG